MINRNIGHPSFPCWHFNAEMQKRLGAPHPSAAIVMICAWPHWGAALPGASLQKVLTTFMVI